MVSIQKLSLIYYIKMHTKIGRVNKKCKSIIGSIIIELSIFQGLIYLSISFSFGFVLMTAFRREYEIWGSYVKFLTVIDERKIFMKFSYKGLSSRNVLTIVLQDKVNLAERIMKTNKLLTLSFSLLLRLFKNTTDDKIL